MTKSRHKRTNASRAVEPIPVEQREFSCADCPTLNCYRATDRFPKACLTQSAPPRLVDAARRTYSEAGIEGRMARAAAEVEGTYYGQLTRAEEIVAFAHRIGAVRIGVATCIGLIAETKIFLNVLRANDLVPNAVLCKVGSIDKTEIGIPNSRKIEKGSHEAACNPILQAKLLNRWKADLNVVVGLCVGHDALFYRYSRAPVTTLITKDRVTGHNPAAALYTCNFYYQRLLQQNRGL